jgi:homoserine dehydrogenase
LALSIASNQEFNPHRYLPFNEYATRSHLEDESRFYLRLATIERPGILALITRILGDHDISISAIIQKEVPSGATEQTIPIVILTRAAREGNLRRAVEEIDGLEVTCGKTIILHVEDIEL